MPEPEAPISERDALAAVGRMLSTVAGAGFELQPILDRITAEAPTLCRADVGFCFLREGDLFRFVSASGGSQEHWEYERTHPDTISRETIVGRVALAGEPVQIADLAVDSEYRGDAYKVGGFRTLLGVPIRTDAGLIGAFGLGRFTVHRSRDRARQPLRRSGGNRHPAGTTSRGDA